MIRAILIATLLCQTAACARPHIDPRFKCLKSGMQDFGGLEGRLRDGKMVWIDADHVEHQITDTPDEWQWTCRPADRRQYPETSD